MSAWTERANALRDYRPGNQWETLLRRAVARDRPQLAKELGAELEPYLRVRTADALTQYEQLVDQGTPPDTAREIALAELLGG